MHILKYVQIIKVRFCKIELTFLASLTDSRMLVKLFKKGLYFGVIFEYSHLDTKVYFFFFGNSIHLNQFFFEVFGLFSNFECGRDVKQ